MNNYKEFDPKLLPLTFKDCNKKMINILGMVKNTKDPELESRLKNLFEKKARKNALWYTYLTLGLVGLFYTKYKFYKPHVPGIIICLGFSYFCGQWVNVSLDFEEAIHQFGETSYPEIDEEVKDFVKRCKISRSII